MTPRILDQFLTLARTLHFGRASEAANISLSALSRNIRQLEDDLGVSLFSRDNRSVSLTAEGRQFEAYAVDALARWQQIRLELTRKTGPLQGEISVYCSVTASYSIVFELLNQFRPDFPGIEIKLHTGDPEHAIPRVLAGSEQISVAARPSALPRHVLFKSITTSELVFITPSISTDSGIPLAPPDHADAWATIPMILSEGGVARNRVDAWFRALKVKPRIYAQVAGNEAIVSMVSLGLGVGVVPRIVLDNSPLVERVSIMPVTPQLQPVQLGLITLNKNLRNPLVNAFWSVVPESDP